MRCPFLGQPLVNKFQRLLKIARLDSAPNLDILTITEQLVDHNSNLIGQQRDGWDDR